MILGYPHFRTPHISIYQYIIIIYIYIHTHLSVARKRNQSLAMLGEELDMALTWNGAFGTRDEAA